ncbi:uncharacterized protein HD556DRAFT_1447086 [Suillus plorans]|uniref:DUF6533 domain-containing protein n=1 Tax=Suillus plorans TaxID=116603 RepID=A0A9P7AIJ0_9AGAM|nr:uncharacterized protein HD556DRAFT_1447086 [Suillus plorans]KAG1789236.1 hypothetical protein HD556DRAFT_1447086 [Suillus plorans]
MTIVSDDPSWWPTISSDIFLSYWMIAGATVVVYDWVLTLKQEIELIWRQHWSLMTLLYLAIRYIGIPYSAVYMLSNITDYAIDGTGVVITAMLGVIMIARLYAMYQGSRMMLIFLVIIFLAVNITCGVIMAIVLKDSGGEELILSGKYYICASEYEGDDQLLISMFWMLYTIWEVLALCLSIWVAVKQFRDLRRLGLSTGSTIGDCFRVLIKSHVLYFASFVCVSCLEFVVITPELLTNSVGAQTLGGFLQILLVIEMFLLGPRLILSVREYNAKIVAESDAETSMDSIVFEEHVHISTSSTV